MGYEAKYVIVMAGAFAYWWYGCEKSKDKTCIILIALVVMALFYTIKRAHDCDEFYRQLGRDDEAFGRLAPGCIPDPGDKDPH